MAAHPHEAPCSSGNAGIWLVIRQWTLICVANCLV